MLSRISNNMKTIIFDLDGTILDTLVDLKNAVNYALNTYHLPQKDLEFVRKAIGNGTTILIKRCTPPDISDLDRQKVFDVFKAYYLEHYADYTAPYQGIKNLLTTLKGQVQLAVVSNKDHDLTNKIINKEFPGLFKIVQGSYLNHPKKPDPYLINKIIKEYKLDKKNILYVGDTNVDKESALNADLQYLLVNYGYRTKEELEKMCPNDTTIPDVNSLYDEILKWVKL